MASDTSRTAWSADDSWRSYRYLADNAIDIVFEATLRTEITWISPSVQDVLGWHPDELVGRHAPEIVHPEDLGAVMVLAESINSGDRVQATRCRMLRKDGTWASMRLRGRPALDEAGSVIGHIVTMQDTSERDFALHSLSVLSEGNRVLARVEHEDELLQQMCEAIVRVGDYPLAWYVQRSADAAAGLSTSAIAGSATDVAVDLGITGLGDRADAGPTGSALRTGTTRLWRDDATEGDGTAPWLAAARQAGLRSSIALPVLVDGVVDGVLGVAGAEPGAFDERTVHLLETLASDLGLGLHRLRSSAALEVQTSKLQSVVDGQLDPIVLLESVRDADGRLVDLRYAVASETALEHNALSREQLIGHTITELFPGQREDGTLEGYFHTIETGEPIVLDDYLYFHEPRGEWHRYDIRAVKCGDGVAITFREVTERFEAARRLAESEARYRLLAEHASDLVWQTDANGRIVWVSDSVRQVLGREPEDLIGHGPDLVHPDERDRVAAAWSRLDGRQPAEGEMRVQRADGTWLSMAVSAHRIESNGEISHVITLRDIDAEVRARQALVHAIGHDPLTGLSARPAMVERIGESLRRLDGRRLAAVLCVGPDRLSSINDAFTHSAGDIALTTLAARLVEAVGNPEQVGRGTGVEFLVLLPDTHGEDPTAVAERILASARQPVSLGEATVTPTASIGIAIGDRTSDPELLVRDASVAMGQAKAEGRDRYTFADESLAEQAMDRLRIEGRIREGLAESRFIPYFQPIVDLATRQLDGYEALVRYVRPDGSIAPPSRFMPVAEMGPMVAEIDVSMLRQALAALDRISAPLSVAVNVSAITLARPGYPALIADLLRDTALDLARLHLEVTETALLGENAAVVQAMRGIADLGARWYVDDFGTGYSSISHLRDLPVSGLKLDVTFSAGIRNGDLTSLRLAQGLAGLAGGLGLDTVAEGVETALEAQTLLMQGWRHGQGYLYGQPEPLH